LSTTFTGKKLDWLTCMRFDRRVTDYAYRIVSVIAHHLNEKTGRAMLSDDTIAFETGSRWPRKVVRARKLLRDLEYLDWEHTRTANVYKPNFKNVRNTLAVIGRARYEKRQRFLDNHARLGRQRHSEHGAPDSDKSGIQTLTPTSDKHLREHLKEESTEEESSSLEDSSLRRAAS
jgi:hypothetical protein